MPHSHSIPRLVAWCPVVLALATQMAVAVATARAQTPVAFTTSTAQFRVVMSGIEGNYVTIPSTISMDIGPPATPGVGTVVVRALRITATTFQCDAPLHGPPTPVFFTGLTVDAAQSPGVSLVAQPGTPGETLFSGSSIAESAAGTVNYNAMGLACNIMLVNGGQCSGPFNLATPGPNNGGIIASGSIGPSAGNQPRAVSLQFRGSFPFVANATWGRLDVLANLAGTIPGGPPACAPDFNGVGGLNVQDIFDFLAAWFAGGTQADFNHVEGVNVQDIFDFLAAWFAGC